MYSDFHPTVFKPRGHKAIFTSDCNNLLKHVFVAVLLENDPMFQGFVLVIFIGFLKIQTIMLLQCLYQ